MAAVDVGTENTEDILESDIEENMTEADIAMDSQLMHQDYNFSELDEEGSLEVLIL